MRGPPTFTFIGHPRDEADIFRARPLSLLRTLSSDDADFVARALSLPPFLLGEVTVGFDPIRGEVITICCLPHEVIMPRGRREIANALAVAVKSGTSVIGLGALIAPVTAGGADLVDQVGRGVTLTNGNAFTAAVLCDQVMDALADRRPDGRGRVAVIGCTGSVGAIVSRLLAARGLDLILIGRTRERVEQALGDLRSTARFASELAAAAAADVLLVLTSAPSAKLGPAQVSAGALVIDAAEPPSLSTRDLDALGEGVWYARGGRVQIPGYRCTYDFGFEGQEETFACLAETYLLAREGIRTHSVGSPSVATAEQLARVARRHGVRPAPLVVRPAGSAGAAENHLSTKGGTHAVASPR